MKGLRKRKDPALCEAAAIGDLPEVDRLLDDGVHPDSSDPDRATALILAASAGHVEVARRLLAAGADPDEQDDSGITALMTCVISNGELDIGGAHPVFVELVMLLLAAGAQIDLEDENDDTALELARSYELDEIVECLEAAKDGELVARS